MDNNFNNKDFEQFVKQNADLYRMFPSERVWKNVHQSLHIRNRLYGLGLGLLLVTIVVVTWIMLENTNKNIVSSPTTPLAVQTKKEVVKTPILIAKTKAEKSIQFTSLVKNLEQNDFVNEQPRIETNVPIANNYFSRIETSKPAFIASVTDISQPISLDFKPATINNNKEIKYSTPTGISNLRLKNIFNSNLIVATNKNTIRNFYQENIKNQTFDNNPLTIESVVNSHQPSRKRNKLSLEIFFTPTISYRVLRENKEFINSAQARNNNLNYTAYTDINKLVTHKPDIGLQMGFIAGYPLSKNLKIIGGLQFNVNKYDIKASIAPTELATIALQSGAGTSNSVSTATNYRNLDVDKTDWLNNLYFSASAPIGLELKLSGNKKSQIGISSTLQPTYILGDRAFLLSTDYKNYAEFPSLTRKWNLSSSFEVFAGYSTGKINWRIGPVVRYQMLSSFKEKYPVKEKLLDFGLKIGVMLRN